MWSAWEIAKCNIQIDIHTTDCCVVHVIDWRSTQLQYAATAWARMDRSMDVPVTVKVELSKGGTLLLPRIMQLHSTPLLGRVLLPCIMQVHSAPLLGRVLLPCIMQVHSAPLLATQVHASSLQVRIFLHSTCDLITDLFNPFWIPDWST